LFCKKRNTTHQHSFSFVFLSTALEISNPKGLVKYWYSFYFLILSAPKISNPKGPIKHWHSFPLVFLSASEISNPKGPIEGPFLIQKNQKHEPNIVEVTHLCIMHRVHTSTKYFMGARQYPTVHIFTIL
jgi:hypothetical protein